MVLPKDPVKRQEALRNIKEAARKRSENITWRENNRKSQIGKKISDETKQRMSESHKGLFVGENNPMFGKDPWNKGKELSEIHKKNIGKANTGKVKSEEFKQKLSEMNMGENNPFFGKHHDPEKFKGEKNGMFGKQRSEEAKLATSLANKGKRLGPDNPAWNGGITPLRKAIRESTEMYEWKRKVMERDNYKDADTGEHGLFEVHHIVSLEELLQKYNIQTLEDARNCKELWDINNGKTMLYENHRKFHGLMGEDEGE